MTSDDLAIKKLPSNPQGFAEVNRLEFR